MAFRDDRDAQLARAAALERENRRLEEELARHKAEAAAAGDALAAAEARAREAAAGEREAALAEENAELREQLARARGPGLLRRAGASIARLRLAEPSGDGGYWRTALEAWRIYVPVTAGLLVGAAFLGTRAIVMALLLPFAAAALAAVVLAIPWLLGRRRRAVAGGIAGGALGPAFSFTIIDALMHDQLLGTMFLAVPMAVVALSGMLVTRAVRWRTELVPLVVLAPIAILPSPAQLFVWTGLAYLGSELAQDGEAPAPRR